MKLRNPKKLYDRKCDKCEKDMKTTPFQKKGALGYNYIGGGMF